jgi:hypothetical protein
MKLTVKTMKGEPFQIDVEPSTTVFSRLLKRRALRIDW